VGSILPIPKILPLSSADYRPITIPPILSRILECIVVTLHFNFPHKPHLIKLVCVPA
jgi:hypothetical protein